MKDELRPNFTQIPNLFLDFLFQDLTEGELRCLLYICRRTYGFGKKSDKISISQLMGGIESEEGEKYDRGTGMSNRGVVISTQGLIDKGIIIKSKRGGVNVFEINFEHVNQVHGTREPSSHLLGNQVHIQKKEKESIEIKRDTSPSFLTDIPNDVIEQLTRKYNATPNEIRTKALSLYNWSQSVGKKYKRYQMFLENALLKDYNLRKPLSKPHSLNVLVK